MARASKLRRKLRKNRKPSPTRKKASTGMKIAMSPKQTSRMSKDQKLGRKGRDQSRKQHENPKQIALRRKATRLKISFLGSERSYRKPKAIQTS
jgi:hypothetical protein